VETPNHGVLKANALYGLIGPAAVKQEVSALLGQPIERHLKVNLAAVNKVADALGGVEVDVPKRMYYVDNSQGLYIDLDPGLQVLKGEKLEGFLRFRHDESGDLGRMERQRLVINQVFRKLAQPATLAQLPALLRIAGEDIHTDLSPLELTQLMSAMAHTKLSTGRLAGREYWENELSYWMPASNTQHPSGHGDVPPN
jgi:LCP family protein required for cell wall assembly